MHQENDLLAAPQSNAPTLLNRRLSLLMVALLVVAVAASQGSLFYVPAVGPYINAVALALLMFISVRERAMVRTVFISAALIPLLGLINLAIVQESAFHQTAILYLSMLILALVYRFIFRENTEDARSHRSARFYILSVIGVAIMGSGLGMLSYALLKGAYIFGGIQLGLVFAVATIGALAEEFLFRGLIQRQAMKVMRSRYAVALTVLLFGTLSLSHFSIWALPLGLLTTGVLSFIYAKTQNLVLTITLNLASKMIYLALIGKYLLH